MRIDYELMKSTFKSLLMSKGFDAVIAEEAAVMFTDNSCDGVASHGLNRFPRVLSHIDQGFIKVNAKPEVVHQLGAIEVVDGHMGLGLTNAQFCMSRAIKMAKKQGIGCVAIRNNNHWMRGATYGHQAAKAGMIGICFTNTCPNMPAWGALDNRLGNNPLVIAVPHDDGAIVLDMAMSQFSYGKMEALALDNQQLPIVGGYDAHGHLTKEPQDILDSGRILPTGFWKGSGLSMVLDLLATVLSGGDSTKNIGERPEEYGVSQVFIAIDPSKTDSAETIATKVEETIAYIHASEPIGEGQSIYYPGEGSSLRRQVNMREGIPVNERIWRTIMQSLEDCRGC